MDAKTLEATVRATEILDVLIDAGYNFDEPNGIQFLDLPDYLTWDSGVTRLVIWDTRYCDFVVKLPWGINLLPYCEKEAEIYKAAVEEGVDDCFGWCKCVCEYEGMPIYAMEFVTCDEDTIEDEAYSDSYEEWLTQENREDNQVSRDTFCDEYWNGWAEDSAYCWFFNQLGEAKRKVGKFFAKYDISDIHSGNLGYIGMRVVICDYAGFGWL